MGTYNDSLIRTARRDYPCEQSRMPTPHSIKKGDRYLDYKLGQRWSVRVCLPCALAAKAGKFSCAAVDDLRASSTL